MVSQALQDAQEALLEKIMSQDDATLEAQIQRIKPAVIIGVERSELMEMLLDNQQEMHMEKVRINRLIAGKEIGDGYWHKLHRLRTRNHALRGLLECFS